MSLGIVRTAAYTTGAIVVAAGLWLTSTHSYLLFHSLVELFRVVVAAAMFAVAWNARRFSRNGYLTSIGIAYLFVASLDLLHTLAYRGMGVFVGSDADLPTQLWIAARAMESVALLVAPVFLVRRVRPWPTLLAYLAVTAALLVVIFPLHAFPTCFVEAGTHPGRPPGLTPFKIAAEYVICAVLLASLGSLSAVRDRVSPRVLRTMIAAILTSVFSELAFTHYASVYGDFNMVGHLLKTASFFLLYKATVEDSLQNPYEALFRDLEEQKGRLAEANRVKDEFLATLSHELRTPLNAVVGWSQMLLDGRLDRTGERRAVEVIDKSARAQVALINDVLDVSRIISGKLRIDARRMDVCDSLDAALDSARPAAEAKGIEIVKAVEHPGTIVGDPDRIQQILWNLLSNAIKFTPKGGRVEVSVRREDSEVAIRVSDNGIGVRAEAIPHLFERFWQADRSPGRQHGGLGLGLAIVRHLVELHGGQVSAQSAGQGEGTTFTVRIPVRAVDEGEAPGSPGEPALESTAAGEQRRGDLAGVKVLVVDDQADARELLDRVLREAGAQTRSASTAQDAFAIVQGWRPHVLLSDIGMPGTDGYEMIRRVRALPPAEGGLTPAIALTAYGTEQDRQRAREAGFDDHLVKPVTPTLVTQAVAELAGRSVPS